jgi:heptosyltransferase II
LRILIIRLSSFGDIILTEPITAVLRKTYPDAEIDFLTSQQYASLPRMFPNISTVFSWNKDKESLDVLKERKYDLVLDLHAKLQSFLIRHRLGAPKNLTYNKKHGLRTRIVNKLTKQTIGSTTELYASVLDKMGIPYKLPRPVIIPLRQKDPLMREAFNEKRESRRIFVGVFPGANHITKIYPIEQMSAVLSSLPEDWKACFVFMGGNQEKTINTILKKSVKYPSIDLTGQLDFLNLAYIVNELDLVISMDSGPMHMAAALEKPQVALFGATSTKLGFAPQNKKAVVIENNIKCQPCSLHGQEKCPKGHFKCMRDINPNEVVTAIVDLYEKFVKDQIKYLE